MNFHIYTVILFSFLIVIAIASGRKESAVRRNRLRRAIMDIRCSKKTRRITT